VCLSKSFGRMTKFGDTIVLDQVSEMVCIAFASVNRLGLLHLMLNDMNVVFP
jgi:hypothetical protein